MFFESMFFMVICLIIGLAVLVWSADKFVYGAAGIARNFGISPLVVGLTIVAMGSSAPEMMASAMAAIDDKPNTGIGNAIGSNIANIAMVLGITALIKPMMVSSSTMRREIPMVLLSSLLGAFFLYNLDLAFYEGVILMVLFFLVIGGLTWFAVKHPEENDPMIEGIEAESDNEEIENWKAILWTLGGIALLIASSKLLVFAASNVAYAFGMSELVVGLTIIAIGTSLPELAASVAGVLKGEDDLAIGNIIGSNIFNILAVLALPALIAPGAVDPATTNNVYVMIGVTVLLALLVGIGKERSVNRFEGGILLACYAAFIYFATFVWI
jgi:cation:H+ antiporter